ncbi:MAG TPA: helix-turn-helix domain-containing protein [Pseudonocardiaceae bacterium]|jgi:PucR-like helix-turn-helix protein/diguanylate cyclase with GGDEF domain
MTTSGRSERAPAWEHGTALSGLSRQNSIYRRTMAVCDELADAALGGADPVRLTEVFARLVGKRIVLLDIAFRLRAQAGGSGPLRGLRWNRTDPSVDRLLCALEAARRPLRIPAIPGSLLDQACLVAPVVVRETSLGYLLVLDEVTAGSGYGAQPDDAEFLTVTYAATLFALTLAHEQTSAELDLRYRSSVVDALVSGHFLDAQDARRKARSLGLGDDALLRVAMLRPVPSAPDCAPGDRAPGSWAQQIASIVPGAGAAVRDGALVVIVPGDPSVDALSALCRLGPGVTCGLSEQVESPELLPRGVRQAERSIDLGLRLGRAGQPVRYEELGIYRLLCTIGDMRQLMGFARDVLGPLLDYDTEHRAELVRTLSVYLHHHGSHKQSARTLHLHTNTVAYRVARIEAISRLDLGDPDDRLIAHVAVKIIEAQGTAE